ncbi:HupE/UreJ family protein, partial [Candidatus Gracilibacteria bacterium]|nr:HupE/UreJ family protein [Candidatus Gracilibacteria bacterium]
GAHSLNSETVAYILGNPDASWSDFQAHVRDSNDPSLQAEIEDTESKFITVLSLPGKQYVSNYVVENPDFSFSDINTLVQDDPMLSEIGPEVIYSFLSGRLQADKKIISFDYFLRFIYLGFDHIMSGYDHILFMMTLIITLPKRKKILLIITTFTIAHSLTIILGGMNIVSLSSEIVESMIVGSIGLMAVYAMFQRVSEERNIIPELILIFVLGLFHGLGFASFFRGILDTSNNIFLPIIGFNLGVELGQILIMSGALIILYFLYKQFDSHKNIIKNIFATLILIMSLIWLSGYIFV